MICPVQTRCGGCPTLHLPRPQEQAAKVARVHTAFEQVGLSTQSKQCIAGDQRSGYRNRLRMKVADGRVDLFNQAKEQGCLALRPELWNAITVLRQLTQADPTLLAGVAHLEVRVDDYAQIGLSFVALDEFAATPGDLYRNRLKAKLGSAWSIADRSASTQPTLQYDTTPTIVNSVPIDAFVQINTEVNRLLVAYVRDAVAAGTFGTFVDLFCGAGNLTIPLIEDGLRGTAVERNGSGPAALVEQTAGRNLNVVTGNVHDRLGELTPAEVVISNPPRSGIKANYQTIASLVSKRMICVGCEPEALAADVAQLANYGLEVTEIQTFDMFPGTDHIETAVILNRATVT